MAEERKLRAAAEQVAARSGRRAIAVPTDVTDDAAVQTLVARTVAELGGPHGVNVGGGVLGTVNY